MIKLSLQVCLQAAAWLSTTGPRSNLDRSDRKVLSLTSNRIVWCCQTCDYSNSHNSRHPPRLGCPFTEHMLQFICQFASTVCTGDKYRVSLLYNKRGGRSVTVCRQAPMGRILLFVPLLLWKGYLKILSKRENYTFLQIEVSISWPFS